MSKYNVGLKTLLVQGLSEPEFYSDLKGLVKILFGDSKIHVRFFISCNLEVFMH